ncbi:hypothetical protein AFM16_02415 [Streptomyces antibioticus]|uniref:Uncharacterized protein n=1 Tax=Streptomyces antibioticus TaxID=1890 RepID=A0AAE6Y4Y7_STRAT|nr:hypothetical protein AFM16_02415 [Streptomyces antibioticus]QIT42542.1 hypothetical protein HCX60_02600 [Streptomyces antibioticus]
MGRVDDTRRWYVASAPERYGRLRVERDDLGAARWLAELGPGQEDFGTVAGIAVPGFAAYVRVLHPASLDERPVSWAEVAAAYGRSVEPGAEWHRLVGTERFYHNASDHGLPGVWDEHPAEGPTPVGVARRLLPVLARHTGTAGRCWFGLWAGYGRRSFDGVPCFETPHRERVLLSGPLDDVLSPVEPDEFAELPDLWWPQDRAWCVGGDVDLVSTYIGGSPELIAELLASPLLETLPVAPGDSVY